MSGSGYIPNVWCCSHLFPQMITASPLKPSHVAHSVPVSVITPLHLKQRVILTSSPICPLHMKTTPPTWSTGTLSSLKTRGNINVPLLPFLFLVSRCQSQSCQQQVRFVFSLSLWKSFSSLCFHICSCWYHKPYRRYRDLTCRGQVIPVVVVEDTGGQYNLISYRDSRGVNVHFPSNNPCGWALK